MAESILRLRVNSKEFDDGLKNATKGLKALVNNIYELSGKFSSATEKEVEYVRAMGKMETESSTARGRLQELTKAYKELQYQMQSAAKGQHDSDLFRAMQQAAQDLKPRIEAARKEVDDLAKSGNTTSASIGSLAEKFGLSIGKLTAFGAALGAGKLALDTLKGSIESNEATQDLLARSIEACDAVTNQFLLDLANADFSNFISGLDDVVRNAEAAYDTLDEFESYAARFNPAQQALESQVQTKLQQARAAKAQGDNARAERLNNEAKALISKLEESTRAYGEKQTAAGYATIRSKMGEVPITDQQIAWYADPKNWETAQAKAKEYKKIIDEIRSDDDTIALGAKPGASYYSDLIKAAQERKRANEEILRNDPSLKRAYTFQNLRDSGEEGAAFNRALLNIHGNDLAESRVESLRARADRMEGVIERASSSSRRYSDTEEIIPEGSIAEAEKRLSDLREAFRKATTSDERNSISEEIKEASENLDILTGKIRSLKKDEQVTFTVQVDSEKLEELKKNIPDGISIEVEAPDSIDIPANVEQPEAVEAEVPELFTVSITADTEDASKKINELTKDISNREVSFRVKPPEMEAGFSGLSTSAIDGWISAVQEDLKEAEFGTLLYDNLTKNLADATALKNAMEVWVKSGLDASEFPSEELWDKIIGTDGDAINDIEWSKIESQINENLKKLNIDPIKINVDTGEIEKSNKLVKDTAFDYRGAANAVRELGNALNSIEDPTAKVTGIIAMAIANIASTFAKALGGCVTVWDWIAGAAAGTATMISTIEAIKSATEYHADGGVVGSNKMFEPIGTDTVPAMLTPGEIVLTAANQRNLANNLIGTNLTASGGELRMELRGDRLISVINNTLRQQGKKNML